MKRIYSFMFAAVAIVAAASCQKEIDTPINNGGDFTITASIGVDTKTVLEDDAEGNKIYWTPGDQISLFNNTGAEVVFSTDITEKSSTATFTNDAAFEAPASLIAVYPTRTDKETTFDAQSNTINTLHIAGSQNAVAGSFDPRYAVAVGTPKAEGSNEFVFTNIHSLVKFTIGGDEAPTTVTLKNNGMRMIAGNFNYDLTNNTATVTAGAGEVSLTGTFEVGKTYYIAVTPGIMGGGVTLLFDGLKAAATTTDINFEPNKIYNLGEISYPVDTPFNLERVAEYYADGTAAWCSFIPEISNRTMAADNKYVYLNSSVATPTIYAVELASLLADDATPTYKTLSTANMTGGAHGVSALRCIPNENGDPILIATNLATESGQNFNIYAYSNGTDKDPVLFHAYRWDGLANVSDWRRYGDRISVSGTWQNGKIWAPSQSGTKVMGFGIENGTTSADKREYCWFDTFSSGLAEVTLYPGTTEALLTTASSAGYWTPNTNGEKHSGGNWPKWDAVKSVSALNGAFSFQFFTFEEKDYIAYVQLPNNKKAFLVVVEDKGSLSESLASEKLFELPLHKGSESSCEAGNTYGDCAVVTVDSKLHIVAMMQGGGLSIFEIQSK